MWSMQTGTSSRPTKKKKKKSPKVDEEKGSPSLSTGATRGTPREEKNQQKPGKAKGKRRRGRNFLNLTTRGGDRAGNFVVNRKGVPVSRKGEKKQTGWSLVSHRWEKGTAMATTGAEFGGLKEKAEYLAVKGPIHVENYMATL